MRKWISYGFIWLAVFLLLGHSLVPHVHERSEEMAISSTTCHPSSSLGILGKLYSVDLGGEGHLESYLGINSRAVTFSASDFDLGIESNYWICATDYSFLPIAKKVVSAPKSYLLLYMMPHFLSGQSLRAPPIC